MAERIQKVLARCGLGSRREVERWIEEGRLSVNNKPAKIGQPLSGGERLALDGRAIEWSPELPVPRVLAYHKPEGEVVSQSDPEGRPTVFENLPPVLSGRWIAVGRLDINTSGLLLFTNHGELAQALMHPSSEFERVYAARVFGDFDEQEAIAQLCKGVELEDGPAKFEKVTLKGGEGANRWFDCSLKEGRFREVRRLWQAVGGEVSRLTRVRYAGIALPRNLSRGMFVDLTPGLVNQLLRDCKLPEVDRDDSMQIAPQRFKKPQRLSDLKLGRKQQRGNSKYGQPKARSSSRSKQGPGARR